MTDTDTDRPFVSLPRMRVAIRLDDDGPVSQFDLTIRHQDQLRAELEAPRFHITRDHVYATADLWAWAACKRLNLFAGAFPDFQARLVDLVKQDDEQIAALEPVDPTRPAASTGTRSPSPTPSGEESTTGSTPTNG